VKNRTSLLLVGVITLVSSLVGCGLIPGVGTSTSTSTSTTTGTGGTSTTAGGTDCGTDPETGAVLCLGNSLCPGITVDSVVYPGCGFRVAGESVDIECSCSGYLCPLGAGSCAEATTMLAAENYSVVCEQVSNGACIQGAGGTTTGTTAATTGASSSSSMCDTTCRDECGGEPTCLQQCGC
jgi:hypothetical protein